MITKEQYENAKQLIKDYKVQEDDKQCDTVNFLYTFHAKNELFQETRYFYDRPQIEITANFRLTNFKYNIQKRGKTTCTRTYINSFLNKEFTRTYTYSEPDIKEVREIIEKNKEETLFNTIKNTLFDHNDDTLILEHQMLQKYWKEHRKLNKKSILCKEIFISSASEEILNILEQLNF